MIRPVPVEVVESRTGRAPTPGVPQTGTHLLKFVRREGRKRQIRKMCSAAHLVVLTLKRVAVGNFELPQELRPGEWRDLTSDEIQALFR